MERVLCDYLWLCFLLVSLFIYATNAFQLLSQLRTKSFRFQECFTMYSVEREAELNTNLLPLT